MQFIPIRNSIKSISVDDEDAPRVRGYSWYLNDNKKCIIAHINKHNMNISTFILGIPPNGYDIVDHKDRNIFNNQKLNLRFATNQQNSANASIRIGRFEYKGVYYRKDINKWRAQITPNGIRYELGIFSNKEDAALAYNKAAIRYFGEFAVLNELESKKDA